MAKYDEVLRVLANFDIPVYEGKVKLADLRKAALADDDGGYALNRRGRKLYDTKGYEAGEKDLQRMRDLKSRANGVDAKIIQLAEQMAKSIDSAEKAARRADAAEKILKGKMGNEVAQIFSDRAEELA